MKHAEQTGENKKKTQDQQKRSKRKPRVIIDTNFFQLVPVFRKDIFEDIREITGDCEYIISLGIIKELENLAEKDMRARIPLKLLQRKIKERKVTVESEKGDVDAWIINYALRLKNNGEEVYVCTNDAALRKRLKTIGVRNIALKGYGKIDIS